MRKFAALIRLVPVALAGLLMGIFGLWGALALWYRLPGRRTVRAIVAGLWLLWMIGLLALAWQQGHGWALLLYVLAWLMLLRWWRAIRPSNDRPWIDDVACLLRGTLTGHTVTLHNVRNFHWRRDDDYDVRWETRHYDLDRLCSADAIISYWSGKAIAHAMMSFGFDDGRHLVFSVEIRRQRGRPYSSIGGFFKQFETILVAADERDIVRVRTNVRGEDDYLYPLTMSQEAMRALFVSYVEAANALAETPRFYHTLSSNCTSLVYRMAKRVAPGLPLDARLLLTGYLPGYLYDNGVLDRRYTLAQWQRRARITEQARRSGPEEDFSRAIREGHPPAR
ncbi:MAG: DUF4105 domain-containing protein [Rhodanobacter sp.]|nr:MAG: DUF4105 domain-containing protein [Rhodanobacter sp.]